MLRTFRLLRHFSLDHSNLSPAITHDSTRNYKIKDGKNQPIDGFLTGGKVKEGKEKNAKHTVIMIHQWWGFNTSITKTAQLFTAMACGDDQISGKLRVFVPDLYRGKPAKNAEQAGHKMNHLDWSKALKDIDTVRNHFAQKGDQVSIMGFCMGGALTWASLASIKGFKAGGVFYGLPDLNKFKVENVTAKVIANFGSQDPLKGFSDPETAKKLAQLAKGKQNIAVKIWPGVSHAFCNQDSKYFKPKTRDEAFEQTLKTFNG